MTSGMKYIYRDKLFIFLLAGLHSCGREDLRSKNAKVAADIVFVASAFVSVGMYANENHGILRKPRGSHATDNAKHEID
jgi:hypothetical protein